MKKCTCGPIRATDQEGIPILCPACKEFAGWGGAKLRPVPVDRNMVEMANIMRANNAPAHLVRERTGL
jgi:hypothetical protein